MIGTYGHYLGFDPEPLVLHYARFLPHVESSTKKSPQGRPHPFGSAKIISLEFAKHFYNLPSSVKGSVLGVLGIALAVAFAYPSWQTAPGIDVARIETVPVVSPRTVPPEENAHKQLEPMEQTASISKVVEDTHRTSLAQSDPLIALLKSSMEAPSTGAPDVGNPKIYGEKDGKSEITLKALGTVWVRVEDAQGKVLFSETLNPGEQYRVPKRPGLVVISRDGGLVEAVVNGVEKGPLGPLGEILIGYALTPEQQG